MGDLKHILLEADIVIKEQRNFHDEAYLDWIDAASCVLKIYSLILKICPAKQYFIFLDVSCYACKGLINNKSCLGYQKVLVYLRFSVGRICYRCHV